MSCARALCECSYQRQGSPRGILNPPPSLTHSLPLSFCLPPSLPPSLPLYTHSAHHTGAFVSEQTKQYICILSLSLSLSLYLSLSHTHIYTHTFSISYLSFWDRLSYGRRRHQQQQQQQHATCRSGQWLHEHRYSVYLLYWYQSTTTDIRHEDSSSERPHLEVQHAPENRAGCCASGGCCVCC